MTISFRAATAAIAFLCLSSAANAREAERRPIVVSVSHTGLDLSRSDHRVRMMARIARAAERACGSRSSDVGEMADIRRCRTEMMADADVQVAAIASRGRLLASVVR